MKMNIKTRWNAAQDKVFYVIYGEDAGNEVACFDGLLQAALVIRYISGAAMNEHDAALALAAISEFDECIDEKKIGRAVEDPFVPE